MTEFLCGLFIGANVTFLVSAMVVAGRPGKIRYKSGALVTYQNSKGHIGTVELVNDLRSDDTFAVVRKPDTSLEFVVAVSSLSS
jgi:hypothetical protein